MSVSRVVGLWMLMAAMCALFVSPAEAGRAEDQAKAKDVETRLGEMFGRMNDADPKKRAAAHDTFRNYRLTDDDYALLYDRYSDRGLRVEPESGDDRARTIDILGVALLFKYHNVPAFGRLDAAWREYFRYLDDPSPVIRAIAYYHVSGSQLKSIELLPTALSGCRDPEVAVRSGAFYLLGRILSEVPQADPRLAEIRELVLRAFQEDHEVERGGLFMCAQYLGAVTRPLSDEIFDGLHGEFRLIAATTLAAVDSSPEMIDRVVAAIAPGDEWYEAAAHTYFNFLATGRGAKSAALVALLARHLSDPDPERRLWATTLILKTEFHSLREAALIEAERLMPQAPEHHYCWREPLAEAVYMCGLKHPEARSVMLRFLHHPSQEIRFAAHHTLLGQFPTAGYYRAEVAFAAERDPDPECRRIARLTLDALEALDAAAQI